MTGGFLLLGLGVLLVWIGAFGGGRFLSRRSQLLRDLGRRAAAQEEKSALSERLKAATVLRRWRPETFRTVQLLSALGLAVLVSVPPLSLGKLPVVAPLLGGLFGWQAPVLMLGILNERRRAALDRAIGDLIGHLRAQTAIHIPLLQALESAPPVVREPLRADLEELVADCRLAPLPSALERFAARTKHPRLRELVEHLGHQQALGVPLAQVFAEEEQHQVVLMKELVRQRIRSATVTMSIVTFLLFLNGTIVFMLPIALRAFAFMSQ